jgi:hypothetical protein
MSRPTTAATGRQFVETRTHPRCFRKHFLGKSEGWGRWEPALTVRSLLAGREAGRSWRDVRLALRGRVPGSAGRAIEPPSPALSPERTAPGGPGTPGGGRDWRPIRPGPETLEPLGLRCESPGRHHGRCWPNLAVCDSPAGVAGRPSLPWPRAGPFYAPPARGGPYGRPGGWVVGLRGQDDQRRSRRRAPWRAVGRHAASEGRRSRVVGVAVSGHDHGRRRSRVPAGAGGKRRRR